MPPITGWLHSQHLVAVTTTMLSKKRSISLYLVAFVCLISLTCHCYLHSRTDRDELNAVNTTEPQSREPSKTTDARQKTATRDNAPTKKIHKCPLWIRFPVLYFKKTESTPFHSFIEDVEEAREYFIDRLVKSDEAQDIIALGKSTCMKSHDGENGRELALERAKALAEVLVDLGVERERIRIKGVCNGPLPTSCYTEADLNASIGADVLFMVMSPTKSEKCLEPRHKFRE